MSDTSDKNLLLEEKEAQCNTNVITVQQNQPVNNTQNVAVQYDYNGSVQILIKKHIRRFR